MENTIKIINVNMDVKKVTEYNDNTKKITMIKESKKRTITNQECWNFTAEDLSTENQLAYIMQMHTNNIENEHECSIIHNNIIQKMNGYKSQDIKKKLYMPDMFVDKEYILMLLQCSQNICYYCKEPVEILYEEVRGPKQWSLDRINNKIGHNKENILIACLDCNVKRKTMYHERYAFTKQLSIVKKN
tara:strand:- start:1504 stop:2067 length:564 start_codon:yes stop_codon:yes gene_type:complete